MENKQRTPLALAIEELRNIPYVNNFHNMALAQAISILESLKPKEREMFEEHGNSCAFSQHFHDIKISKMSSSERLDYVNKETKTIGEKMFDTNLTQE